MENWERFEKLTEILGEKVMLDAIKYWSSEDEMGEAKQICAKDILMRYTFKDKKCEVIGTKCYESREEVYRHNDLIVKEDDGSERLVECIGSKMKLTEEQYAIIKELEDVLQKTKDVGLR